MAARSSFRSLARQATVSRAYPTSTGWRTESRYPTKQSAHLGAVDFVRSGKAVSGTVRVIEIREPSPVYLVKYKAKVANPRRPSRASGSRTGRSNPQPAVERALYRAKRLALDGHTRYVWNSKGVLKVTKTEPPRKGYRQYWTVTPGGSARLTAPPLATANPRRSRSTPRSKSNPPFADAKIRVGSGGKVDILIPNPPASSAAAFLKVMGRRRNPVSWSGYYDVPSGLGGSFTVRVLSVDGDRARVKVVSQRGSEMSFDGMEFRANVDELKPVSVDPSRLVGWAARKSAPRSKRRSR